MRAFLAFIVALLASFGVARAQPSWYPASGYLSCNENFSGPTLNYGLWSFGHNGAVQFFGNQGQDIGTPWNYMMLPGGGMAIITRHQNFPVTIATTANWTSAYPNTHNYNSVGCSNQTYGYFETSFQLPSIAGGANGLWPADWLIPATGTSVWEMDILERFTSEQSNTFDNTHIWSTLHYNDYANFAYLCTAQDAGGFATSTHKIGLDWEPSSMQIYVDGVLCTNSTNNPTGTYTGAGIPTTPGFKIYDDLADHVSNLAQEEQCATLNGCLYKIFYMHNYQQNANSQAQVTPIIAGQPTLDRPMNGASPPIYEPGDNVTVTVNVTANPSGDTGVYIAASLWDWCEDNGSSSSPCMYPYNNQVFGTTTNSSPTVNLSANQTQQFTVTYAIPTFANSKQPPVGYLYWMKVQACDSAACQWSSEVPIQIGNLKP